jgi:hypothetical protein
MLQQIARMTEAEQCELLEAMLLRQRSSELGWDQMDRVRAKLPKRTDAQVKHDADAAVRQVRRELARSPRV